MREIISIPEPVGPNSYIKISTGTKMFHIDYWHGHFNAESELTHNALRIEKDVVKLNGGIRRIFDKIKEMKKSLTKYQLGKTYLSYGSLSGWGWMPIEFKDEMLTLIENSFKEITRLTPRPKRFKG